MHRYRYEQAHDKQTRTIRALHWIARQLDTDLGMDLWAIELEVDAYSRRSYKFGCLALVLGFLLYVARWQEMPLPRGILPLCQLCERPAWGKDAAGGLN